MRKLLLGSAVAVALLTGCGEEKKESTNATETTQEIKKDETVAAVEKSSVEVKENSKVEETKIEESKETVSTIVEKNKENKVIAPEKIEADLNQYTKNEKTISHKLTHKNLLIKIVSITVETEEIFQKIAKDHKFIITDYSESQLKSFPKPLENYITQYFISDSVLEKTKPRSGD